MISKKTLTAFCLGGLLTTTAPMCSAQPSEKPSEIKQYDQIITPEFKSQEGLFKVHRHKEKLYFEIPKSQLNKDMLMVTQVAKTKVGSGWGGDPVDDRLVRWTRKENKILLLSPDYDLTASSNGPVSKGVEAAQNPTILYAFPIEAMGEGDSAVIEVSKIYLTPTIELTPKYLVGANSLERDRSFLEKAKAYPENIEVESTLTLQRNPDSAPGKFWPGFNSTPMPYGSASLLVHYSLVKLPDQPMKPRLADDRVGYFSHHQYDFGRPHDHLERRDYIARWRLEKKDPQQAVSEPIKPITFYIDPNTPTQWVPFIKKGVEQWQPAFEEAGFKKAIVALEAPKDRDFSPEDARYSVIRWVPSQVMNAYGPHISDPRSGEILEADIHMFDNIIELQRNWYFTQVSPLDKRAQFLPMPDELMGQLIEFVVAHEVGHSLGLPHNMKASSTYPAAKVRDKEWVKTMGHCPSIMDYCRFNYVAQPEDGIEIKDLIPKVGPYDRFSIMWGYKPIAGAAGPDEEKSTLDEWARQQEKTPWLRFSTPGQLHIDPGDQSEAVGDADAVASTRAGVKNIQRVMGLLLNATAKYGENYKDTANMYTRVVGQWRTEVYHVLPIIGGVDSINRHAGQSGSVFRPVSKDRQQQATTFLLLEALQEQSWLYPEQLVSLIGGDRRGQVMRTQQGFLRDMVSGERLSRMMRQWESQPMQAYSPVDYLREIRSSVFAEVKKGGSISRIKAGLQETYTEELVALHRGSSGAAAALARQELQTLLHLLRKERSAKSDPLSSAHLDNLSAKIQQYLDPASPLPIATSPTPTSPRPSPKPTWDCWHDYQLDEP